MRIEMDIEGMSCPGCERTVSRIIERNGGSVELVSAREGKAVFTISDVDSVENIVREIQEKGYRVMGMERKSD